MKRVILLFTIAILGYAAKAQSIQLTFGGSFNDTIYSDNLTLDVDYEMITVKNVASSSKAIKVQRMLNNVTPGQENWFCWDNCYSPNGNLSANALTIASGATSYAFTLHANANGNPGISTTLYRLFDANNPTDMIEHAFVYKFTNNVGIEDEINKAQVLSAPVPNPANTMAKMTYHFPRLIQDAALLVYDLNGRVVYKTPLNSTNGLIVIDTESMVNGLYQVVLQGEGKFLSEKKLVVAR